MYNFALIGAAGYVAPKHMKAIKDTGNNLVAALDTHDSVGVLDRYFPNCEFFSEVERFDRHLERLRRANIGVDYVSICSPNYLHDAHCRLALRIGASAICEKPLVLNPWNIDQLEEIERESPGKVNVVLQLRLHPELIKIKESLSGGRHDVSINYITPRGSWYFSSWKGDIAKSGGLITNIGIHLLDLVIWLFGSVGGFGLTKTSEEKIAGSISLENASVSFSLSTIKSELPAEKKSFRSITIDGEEVQLDNVFTDLHTEVYRQALSGNGFSMADSRPALELAYNIREESNHVYTPNFYSGNGRYRQ